ncbi:hypothetical protein [Vibrio metschnikovii]|uniref:hypothetical protein n=1 Tax=Vibrio metschnikovii TaxID=28172 RepID=UPI002FC5F70E
MPSFLMDKSHKILSVMSFDPIDDTTTYIDDYSPNMVGKYWINGELYDTPRDITVAKAEKILEIKAEAERRIGLLGWRLERAKEREALGIVGYETVNDIYQLKEDIRQWSNQLEVELMQLESVEEVNLFSIPS